MPLPPNRLIVRPRMFVLPAVTTSPSAAAPAFVPSSWIRGAAPPPGWVRPSRLTGLVIAGRADWGAIVFSPDPMANRIVSLAGLALDVRMAWRSDPGPRSFAFVTVMAANNSRCSSGSDWIAGDDGPAAGADRSREMRFDWRDMVPPSPGLDSMGVHRMVPLAPSRAT